MVSTENKHNSRSFILRIGSRRFFVNRFCNIVSRFLNTRANGLAVRTAKAQLNALLEILETSLGRLPRRAQETRTQTVSHTRHCAHTQHAKRELTGLDECVVAVDQKHNGRWQTNDSIHLLVDESRCGVRSDDDYTIREMVDATVQQRTRFGSECFVGFFL